jgi:hypothetical protein
MAKLRPIDFPNGDIQINRKGMVVCTNYINLLGVRAVKFYVSNSTHLVYIDPLKNDLRTPVLISANDCLRWGKDFESLRLTDINKGIEDRTYETRISATAAVMCWLTGVFNVNHFKDAVECLYSPRISTVIRSFKIIGAYSENIHILPDDQLIYHMATYDIDGKIIE